MSIRILTSWKPFDAEFGPIQRAAVASWRRHSRAEITVLGDEEAGSAQAARDFGVTLVRTASMRTARDLGFGYGAPLLTSIVEQGDAQTQSDQAVVLWLNADLILVHDVDAILEHVFSEWPDPFMVGRRRNVKTFKDAALGAGTIEIPTGADVFAWRRGFFARHGVVVPPYILGRFAWDQWLMRVAIEHARDPVDPTEALHVCHPEHGYGHMSGVEQGVEAWSSAGAGHNLHLSPESHAFKMTDQRWRRLPASLLSACIEGPPAVLFEGERSPTLIAGLPGVYVIPPRLKDPMDFSWEFDELFTLVDLRGVTTA